jgi:hypothetical protein
MAAFVIFQKRGTPMTTTQTLPNDILSTVKTYRASPGEVRRRLRPRYADMPVADFDTIFDVQYEIAFRWLKNLLC